MDSNTTFVGEAEMFDVLCAQLPTAYAQKLKAAAARCALRHPSVYLPCPSVSPQSPRQNEHLQQPYLRLVGSE